MRHLVLFLFSISLLGHLNGAGAADPLPSGEEIMKRVAARSNSEPGEASSGYRYLRKQVREELNKKGEVDERVEETFEMIPIGSKTFARKLLVNGKPLSPAEQRKEQEREREFREKLKETDAKEEEAGSIKISEDLIKRFLFQVVRHEVLNGRQAYVVSFRPKGTSLPEKEIFDRVVNKLHGTLWVDAADSEVARLEVQLMDRVNIGWKGMIATLTAIDLTLEKKRFSDGAWLTSRSTAEFVGRQLFSSTRIRQFEECSEFEKEEQVSK